MKKFSFKSKKGVLLQNTLMLYILTFSTYILSFIVVPYQTRVLTEDLYGSLIGASAAIILYFQLVIDFGFLLSATEEVSKHRDDRKKLCTILTSVTIAKLFLAAISFVILFVLCQFIPDWKEKELFLYLTFAATFFASMMPDYLYRGIEKMTAVTVRTVAIKVFFTLGIFVLFKKPEQAWIIPTLNILGNGAALIAAIFHIKKSFGIGFIAVRPSDIFHELKRSSTFFFSRIATTAYTALNTILLDIIGSKSAISYYSSSNQLINTGKSALSPISDSMYPYMAKNRDFKLVKKVLLVFEPIIFVFCTVVFIWACPLCEMFFGEGFYETGYVLRAMLPVGVIVLPSYIFGFPTLTPMGLTKHANYSTIVGSIFHFSILATLFFTGTMNAITLAASVSLTEGLILFYRIVVIVKNKHLMSKQEDN
ncbi:MAG: oligosaccharide flippase family protein [Clostridia bacterium]|nr:oligosaccharide flippase family protein [Clostridia bacterium]